jgi:hypothetical protein
LELFWGLIFLWTLEISTPLYRWPTYRHIKIQLTSTAEIMKLIIAIVTWAIAASLGYLFHELMANHQHWEFFKLIYYSNSHLLFLGLPVAMAAPTNMPTAAPTNKPTATPTAAPTKKLTTAQPTAQPTTHEQGCEICKRSKDPTRSPNNMPTAARFSLW